LAVECKKPFLDIDYGFPVIVMRRGGPFKKNYLNNPKKKVDTEKIGHGSKDTTHDGYSL
jgi:hypothetical protein